MVRKRPLDHDVHGCGLAQVLEAQVRGGGDHGGSTEKLLLEHALENVVGLLQHALVATSVVRLRRLDAPPSEGVLQVPQRSRRSQCRPRRLDHFDLAVQLLAQGDPSSRRGLQHARILVHHPHGRSVRQRQLRQCSRQLDGVAVLRVVLCRDGEQEQDRHRHAPVLQRRQRRIVRVHVGPLQSIHHACRHELHQRRSAWGRVAELAHLMQHLGAQLFLGRCHSCFDGGLACAGRLRRGVLHDCNRGSAAEGRLCRLSSVLGLRPAVTLCAGLCSSLSALRLFHVPLLSGCRGGLPCHFLLPSLRLRLCLAEDVQAVLADQHAVERQEEADVGLPQVRRVTERVGDSRCPVALAGGEVPGEGQDVMQL